MIYFITHQYRSWFGGCLLASGWTQRCKFPMKMGWSFGGYTPFSHKAIYIHLQCVNMRTMVLEYLATFARRKSPSHVGKYISTMEHLGYVINLWSWKKSTLLMYESTQASRPNIACLGPKTFVIIADAFKQFQTSIAILVRKLFSLRRNWLIEQFVPFNCARTDRIFAELVWRFPKIGVSPVIVHCLGLSILNHPFGGTTMTL